MAWVLLFAVMIVYVLMASLFESFVFPFVVLWTVPLAAVGGLLGLRLLGLFTPQRLDVLAMLGFIILVGTVVNNAILLVAQTRAAQDQGLGRQDAVRQALRYRLRPIFMSTLTSLFGMLPLLVVPGAGSEIYRGMAAAIVGGMAVSTLFTLLLLPSLLQLAPRSRSARLPTDAVVAD